MAEVNLVRRYSALAVGYWRRFFERVHQIFSEAHLRNHGGGLKDNTEASREIAHNRMYRLSEQN